MKENNSFKMDGWNNYSRIQFKNDIKNCPQINTRFRAKRHQLKLTNFGTCNKYTKSHLMNQSYRHCRLVTNVSLLKLCHCVIWILRMSFLSLLKTTAPGQMILGLVPVGRYRLQSTLRGENSKLWMTAFTMQSLASI